MRKKGVFRRMKEKIKEWNRRQDVAFIRDSKKCECGHTRNEHSSRGKHPCEYSEGSIVFDMFDDSSCKCERFKKIKNLGKVV